jgi:hypothetical protein
MAISHGLKIAGTKKKAAPLGAAVIATLNHITVQILPAAKISEMG